METRREYLKRDSNVADNDTTLLDLKFSEPLSYLTVEFEATNGATSCLDHEPHDDVSVIEVVDGSEVITSLSMTEWLAANAYRDKRMPDQDLSEIGGAVQKEKVVIPFGRYPFDPEFYLDTRQYSNPQLRIENALTVSATAGFATGTGKITVIAHLMKKGYSGQRGYIGYKEIKAFTAGTSGDEEVTLPRKHSIKSLGVMALLSTYTPQEVLTKWKLDLDTGKEIPFDMYTEDIVDMCLRRYGLMMQSKHILTADDGSALTDIYDIREAHIRANVDDHIATIESVDAEKISNQLIDMSSPATPAFESTAKDCVLQVKGIAPSAVLVWPFGDEEDPGSWADFTPYESAILYLTQAQAGAVKVWVERHMT